MVLHISPWDLIAIYMLVAETLTKYYVTMEKLETLLILSLLQVVWILLPA